MAVKKLYSTVPRSDTHIVKIGTELESLGLESTQGLYCKLFYGRDIPMKLLIALFVIFT